MLFKIPRTFFTIPLFFGAIYNQLANAADVNKFHISFAAALSKPNDDVLQNNSIFSIQLASSVKAVQVGLEATAQYHAPADYSYHVPYNKITEDRNIDIYSGFLILRFSPWHDGYLTPYIGGFFGGSYVLDNAPNSPYYSANISKDKVLLGGPSLGLEILPDGFISIFVETRKSFQLLGHLQRPEIVSVDPFGTVKQSTKDYNIAAISLTAGFRFNF